MNGKNRFSIVVSTLIGAVFALPVLVSAQMLPQTNAWTIVRAATSTDSNMAFYIGTSTVSSDLTSFSMYLSDPSFTGIDTQLKVTCLDNQYNTSQAGCTDATSHSSNVVEVLNPTGQVYFYTFSSPITFQIGKVYLIEFLSWPVGVDNVAVFGDVAYQFSNQCNYAGFSIDCTGAPYWTFSAVPNWTGLNATSTALTALYQGSATSTLGIIQTRCVQDGAFDFGYALCTAGTFLFIPEPSIINNYVALPDTMAGKFPFSWYHGVKNAFTSLSASSTANMASVSIPFASVDPATSTPFGAILPNATLLSSTTISTYLSPSILSLILSLEIAAIWVLFGLFIFHDVQRRWLKN